MPIYDHPASRQLLVHCSAQSTRLTLPHKRERPERHRSCQHCPATFTRAGKLSEWGEGTVYGRCGGKGVYAHHCDVCGKTFHRP